MLHVVAVLFLWVLGTLVLSGLVLLAYDYFVPTPTIDDDWDDWGEWP